MARTSGSPSRTALRPDEIVSRLYRWIGLPALVRATLARRRVSVLMYHDPEPEVFRDHVRFLSAHYNIIPLGDLVDALETGDWAALPSRAVVITFDDGHARNVELAPLLREHGIQPTFYVCSQLVGTNRHFWFLDVDEPEPFKHLPQAERLAALQEAAGFDQELEYPSEARQALSSEELRVLATTADIGSHTRFHPVLTRCSDAECEREIAEARFEVEQLSGRPCLHFSYPNGNYGGREIGFLREAGYRSARTIEAGWNKAGADPYRLKILGLYRDDASVHRLCADLGGLSVIVVGVRKLLRRRR